MNKFTDQLKVGAYVLKKFATIIYDSDHIIALLWLSNNLHFFQWLPYCLNLQNEFALAFFHVKACVIVETSANLKRRLTTYYE